MDGRLCVHRRGVHSRRLWRRRTLASDVLHVSSHALQLLGELVHSLFGHLGELSKLDLLEALFLLRFRAASSELGLAQLHVTQ